MTSKAITKLFITGTGTEIGKTVVASALAHGLSLLGQKVSYWKPVQCGLEEDKTLIAKRAPSCALLENGYTFETPASPDQAARIEGKKAATLSCLHNQLEKIPQKNLIIEGAGGLFVPLNEDNETFLDFITEKKEGPLDTILVAQSTLGTLNHTALAITAMAHRGCEPSLIVLSGSEHLENERSLKRMFPHLAERFYAFKELEGLEKNPLWDIEAKKLAEFLSAREDKPLDPGPLDREYLWHPFTQHKTMPEPLALQSAKGPWLKAVDGKLYFDATSSWWVNTIGHGRREIAAAIARQQQTLDHSLFANTCHAPSGQLGRRLSQLTGGYLSRVFFTDNGSCAVEVAMKMALQLAHNKGKPKRKFVCLKGGYHGDTFGAMAVGKSSGFYPPFEKLLFENVWLSPVTEHKSALCPLGPKAMAKSLEEAERLFQTEKDAIAGLLIEPWVQGAAGMLVQHQPWLEKLGALANAYGIPLILDEVFSGMGRSGAFFAYQRAGLKPDIVCISKGLTGGNLPLALTLTTKNVFKEFLSDDPKKALLHGHSFTANPIACSAALATLDIYEKDNLIEKSLWLEKRFRSWLLQEEQVLGLQNPRVLGAILAFELPGTPFGDYFSHKAKSITLKAREKGLMLRPLGNTVYLVPPLATKKCDIEWALETLSHVIKAIC